MKKQALASTRICRLYTGVSFSRDQAGLKLWIEVEASLSFMSLCAQTMCSMVALNHSIMNVAYRQVSISLCSVALWRAMRRASGPLGQFGLGWDVGCFGVGVSVSPETSEVLESF